MLHSCRFNESLLIILLNYVLLLAAGTEHRLLVYKQFSNIFYVHVSKVSDSTSENAEILISYITDKQDHCAVLMFGRIKFSAASTVTQIL